MGYVPGGKQVPEWKSEPQGPKAPDARPFAPYSDGSRNDYNRPWPGDREAQPGVMSRVAQGLQQNIGNYLLYKATMGVRDIDQMMHEDRVQTPKLPTPGELGPGPAGSMGPGPGPARPHGPSGPAGAVGPGPRGLPSPAISTKTPAKQESSTGSAAPLGPSRSGVAPDRGIGAAKDHFQAEVRDDFTNKDQTASALFPREAFNGPIAMGPAKDRKPKGRDQRAKNRGFDQLSFDI